jgi:hypothetical protein
MKIELPDEVIEVLRSRSEEILRTQEPLHGVDGAVWKAIRDALPPEPCGDHIKAYVNSPIRLDCELPDSHSGSHGCSETCGDVSVTYTWPNVDEPVDATIYCGSEHNCLTCGKQGGHTGYHKADGNITLWAEYNTGKTETRATRDGAWTDDPIATDTDCGATDPATNDEARCWLLDGHVGPHEAISGWGWDNDDQCPSAVLDRATGDGDAVSK